MAKKARKKQRVIKNETTHKPEIDDSNFDDPLIRIEWDSITLRNMPRSVIEDNKKDGLVGTAGSKFWDGLLNYCPDGI